MNKNRSLVHMDIAFDFRKSFLQNLLITAQIAVLVWVTTLVCSFLVPSNQSAVTDGNGGYYFYQAATSTTDSYQLIDQLISLTTDASAAVQFEHLYEELHNQTAFTFFLCQENALQVTASDVQAAFGEDSILPFCSRAQYNTALSTELIQQAIADGTEIPNMSALAPDDTARYSNSMKTYAYSMRAFFVDSGAMTQFDLQVCEGALFSEADFEIKSSTEKETSILMGSAYAEYYDVGDVIMLYYGIANVSYRATVIGFLEEGSVCTTKTLGEALEQSLDYAILFPFTLYTSSNLYTVSHPYTQTYSEGWGIALEDDSLQGISLMVLQQQVQDLFLNADVTVQHFGALSYGMIFFQNDSSQEMLIIFGLCLTALLFCSYTVASFTQTKLRNARKYYAIQILCGRTPQSVICSFVLMQGVWHLLASVLALVWFYHNAQTLLWLCALVSAFFFGCNAVQIVVLQRNLLGQSDFMQHIMEVQDDTAV